MIVGVIQARANSTRLPGKVMMPILGKPILWHIYNRLKNCKLLKLVIISTGDLEKNSEITEFASNNSIPFFVGSETDLIDRLYKTAMNFQASAIVRITGDCPLVDPKIVDELVSEFVKNNDKYDIVTNCQTRTFPHGLDVEIYSLKCLTKLWNEIKEPELREWFPFYVNKNQSLFQILNIPNSKDLSNYRWTIDYPEDYEFVKQIYHKLYRDDSIFSMGDIIQLLQKQPELMKINSKYVGMHNVGSPQI